MRKKLLFLIIAIVLSAGTAGAAEFSLSGGAGAFLGGLFTRYELTGDGTQSNQPIQILSTDEANQFNFGGFLFVDGTWAELNVGIRHGTYTFTRASDIRSGSTKVSQSVETGSGSETALTIGILGKYPIALNGQFDVYPLLGVEYQIALLEYRKKFGGMEYNRTDGVMESDRDGNAYPLSVWNSFFINVGAGLDYRFSSSLFLRTELVYGFRLMTDYEKDMLESAKKMLNTPDPKMSGLTSGPMLKIAVGWRFS